VAASSDKNGEKISAKQKPFLTDILSDSNNNR